MDIIKELKCFHELRYMGRGVYECCADGCMNKHVNIQFLLYNMQKKHNVMNNEAIEMNLEKTML